jgi:hypothetical protein
MTKPLETRPDVLIENQTEDAGHTMLMLLGLRKRAQKNVGTRAHAMKHTQLEIK